MRQINALMYNYLNRKLGIYLYILYSVAFITVDVNLK